MRTNTLDTIGKKINGNKLRDAIHLATLPVQAAEDLKAGNHIGLQEQKATTQAETLIGIVDPFLEEEIKPGDWFWLFIYPRTITSLNHSWEHPDVDNIATTQEPTIVDERLEAQEWIRSYLQDAYDLPSYERLLWAAKDYDGSGSLYIGDEDIAGEITDELWEKLQIATGTNYINKPEYFRCAC